MNRSLSFAICPLAKCLAFAGLLFVNSTKADPITVLGRTFDPVPPPGYCEPHDSNVDRIILQNAKRNMNHPERMLRYYAPCDELAEVRRKWPSSFSFTRWAVIATPSSVESMTAFTGTRAEFLRQFSQEAQSTFNLETIGRRISQRPRGANIALTPKALEALAVTPQAYLAHVSARTDDAIAHTSSQVDALLAITLVNQVPILLTVCTTPEAGDSNAGTALQSMLDQLVGKE